MSTELPELKVRLIRMELQANEAAKSLTKYPERETKHRDRLHQLQPERDATVSGRQPASASLTVSYVVYYLCQEVL